MKSDFNLEQEVSEGVERLTAIALEISEGLQAHQAHCKDHNCAVCRRFFKTFGQLGLRLVETIRLMYKAAAAEYEERVLH